MSLLLALTLVWPFGPGPAPLFVCCQADGSCEAVEQMSWCTGEGSELFWCDVGEETTTEDGRPAVVCHSDES